MRVVRAFLRCRLASVGRDGKGLVAELVIKNINGMNHWRIRPIGGWELETITGMDGCLGSNCAVSHRLAFATPRMAMIS